VAITGILILGLSAVIEIPRRMMEDSQSGEQNVAATDVTLSQLDKEVRYSKDVAVPTPTNLQVTDHGGNVISFAWDGTPGGDLVRSGPDGTVSLLTGVQSVAFRLGMTPMTVVDAADATLNEVNVNVGEFNSWSLLGGFGIGGGPGLISVSLIKQTRRINNVTRSLIQFVASGLSDDDARPTTLTLRLRRNGTDDVWVMIYEKAAAWDRSLVVATGKKANGDLPVAFADVMIPLTTVKKLVNGRTYFIELTSVGGAHAAEIEYELLSLAIAAGPSTNTFMGSSDAGASYAPLSVLPNASQTRFRLEAAKSTVTNGGTGAAEVTMVPTSVIVNIGLISPMGPETVQASFPIENKLALVNQLGRGAP
jgi:hypothetical protein